MIDTAIIRVRSGQGGSGVVTARREKYVPYGGPDGGDGGKAGSVYLKASRAVNTLAAVGHKKVYSAANGGRGGSRNKHGANGPDLVLEVPVGTEVFRVTEAGDEFLADLASEGDKVEVARGGRGGRGNARFATSTNQMPWFAEQGQAVEEWLLRLELRLLADVGIVGYPNVGKSSLLAAASAARPRVADYPFTTTEPVLGVVDVGWRSFVLAEVPGLIEGAHAGAGLGHEFLRHAERTRLLIHLLDGSRPDVVADVQGTNGELELFDHGLRAKPQIVAVNKIDLPEVRSKLTVLDEALSPVAGRVHHVSAATGDGVPQLMADVARRLVSLEAEAAAKPSPGVVFRPAPVDVAVRVARRDGVFEILDSGLELLYAAGDKGQAQLRDYVRRRLSRGPIATALRQAGIKPGDKVRVGEMELEWQ